MLVSGCLAAEMLRQRQPSYFMSWPDDLLYDSQVHVLDTPIYAARYRQFVIFRSTEKLTESEVEKAASNTPCELGLNEQSRAVVNEPIAKGEEALFRTDGDLYMAVKDRILAVALDTTRAKSSDGEGTASKQLHN